MLIGNPPDTWRQLCSSPFVPAVSVRKGGISFPGIIVELSRTWFVVGNSLCLVLMMNDTYNEIRVRTVSRAFSLYYLDIYAIILVATLFDLTTRKIYASRTESSRLKTSFRLIYMTTCTQDYRIFFMKLSLDERGEEIPGSVFRK